MDDQYEVFLDFNASVTKREKELRKYLNSLKMVPCKDCGRSFHPVCMDFDHRDPREKKSCVSLMPRGVAQGWIKMADFVSEIRKCDVVCSNCHRLRTFNNGHAGVRSRRERTLRRANWTNYRKLRSEVRRQFKDPIAEIDSLIGIQ